MRKYEKYKPSGIEWIREIPHNWKVVRVKETSEIVSGSTPSSSVDTFWDGEIVWVTPGDFNISSNTITDSESKITEAGYKSCGTTLVPKGSIVLTTRAPIGNVLIAGKALCTNQGCKTLVPKRIENRLLYYLMSISNVELNVLGQGTTFLELSKENLGTFKLPFPPNQEHEVISDYLDLQTKKIDKLIANKKAQVEKLKELRQIEIKNAVTKGLNPKVEMKESEVNYLEEIPKHWTIKRIKNICEIINGSTPSSGVDNYWDGDVIWVTPGDFKNYNFEIGDSESKITEEGYKSCGTTLVPKGSIILTTRAPIGNVLIAGKELCTNQGCKSIVPKLMDSTFLYFVFAISSKQLNVLGQGTTFLELSTGNLGIFRVPYPPFEEQISIGKYLKERTSKIDLIIANTIRQIEKLQELRKIKIYEAVTGKIKVNEYVEATA